VETSVERGENPVPLGTVKGGSYFLLLNKGYHTQHSRIGGTGGKGANLANSRNKLFPELDKESIPFYRTMPLKLREHINNHPNLCSAWLDFVKHRRQMKRPLTDGGAKQIFVSMLEIISGHGINVLIETINKTIRKSWLDIFMPKDVQSFYASARPGVNPLAKYARYHCHAPHVLDVFITHFEGEGSKCSYTVTESDKYRLSEMINVLIAYHKYAIQNNDEYRQFMSESERDIRPVGLARLFFAQITDEDSDFGEIRPSQLNCRFGKLFQQVVLKLQEKIGLHFIMFNYEFDKPSNLYAFVTEKGLLNGSATN